MPAPPGKLDHMCLSQQHGSFAKKATGYVRVGFGHGGL